MRHLVTNLQVARLERHKRRVEEEIVRLEEQIRAEIDPDIDEGDPGLTEQVTAVSLLGNARRKADEIERALGLAQAGGYGVCEDCRQPIAPERLEIFPQATRCVPCQGAREQPGRQGWLRAA